jgi:hypothetical protein
MTGSDVKVCRTWTKLRDAAIDSSGYSRNGDGLPWLSAQVVVSNDKPQAYGRRTQGWLGYGVHLGELKVRPRRWGAGGDARDGFEGDPEIARFDREAEDRRTQVIRSSPEHAAQSRLPRGPPHALTNHQGATQKTRSERV